MVKGGRTVATKWRSFEDGKTCIDSAMQAAWRTACRTSESVACRWDAGARISTLLALAHIPRVCAATGELILRDSETGMAGVGHEQGGRGSGRALLLTITCLIMT